MIRQRQNKQYENKIMACHDKQKIKYTFKANGR
jgi:hypothetical protein